MKISPLAAYMSIQIAQNKFSEPSHVEFTKQIYKFASELTIMTHRTTMAIQATIAQLVALTYCLSPYCDFEAGDQFDDQQFVTLITDASHYAKRIATNFGLEEDKEDITAQFQKLHDHTEYNTDRTRAEFGNGSCYLLHSIPFSLMFFVKNPHSMDAMYDVISAGGDADTNGSMVGSLLGALHGEGFFPVDLVAELDRKEEVLEVADKFCDTFIRAS